MISHPALQEIQDRLNIVEVIGGTLPLKKAGRNFKGLCPFHSEKTPSFMIYPEKQFFICYGCGAAGDLITFVMKHERMEFPEAVELLARKAGLPVPQFGSKGASTGAQAQLLRAHEWAARVYRELLANSAEAKGARAYLEKRGLEPAHWETFQLGYAPERWDHLCRSAGGEGFSQELLLQAGLAIKREQGDNCYDRFRSRVIFPIWDARGRVIAFSGRLIEEDPKSPKYLNSPETQLYVKGKVLYGLHLAAPHIREQDFCIVVEGNMDWVTPVSRGFRNVVASMGTALTEAQVKLIRRLTRNVVIVYDGDAAGQAATLRGLDLFLQQEMRVRVAVLPAGTDPDSLIRKQGVEAFARALKECKELFDYKLGGLLRRWNPKELEGRIGICQEMLPTLKRVPNAIQRGEYIRRLAETLDIGEALLWKELERVKLQSSDWKPEGDLEAPLPPREVSIHPPEEVLAGLLLEDPVRVEIVESGLGLEDFRDPAVRELVAWLMECRSGGALPSGPADFWKRFPRESGPWEARRARWLAEADSTEDKERALDQVIVQIRKARNRASKQDLCVSLQKAEELGNEEEVSRLIVEINRLNKLQETRRD